MPRTFSNPLTVALNSEEFNQYMLMLVSIVSTSQGTLRYVRGYEQITSLGRVFAPATFNLQFPDEGGESPPTINATFDIGNTTLITALRGDRTRPTVQLEIALKSSPDTIEDGPMTFQVLRYARKDNMLTVDLGYEPVLNEAIPAERYTPNLFPGLFTSN